MYTPPIFAETDQEKIFDLIERYSFATLVSHDGSEPLASHLPLLLDRDATPRGRIVGHMASANRHWQQADGQPVLVIFQGPHTYVSPTWYGEPNVVPTWNYVAVHVYGRLLLDHDRASRLEVVRRYVDTYEASFAEPWRLDDADPTWVDSLLDGIVCFHIDIERFEGKAKLNQNQSLERRRNVIRALRKGGRDDQREIADLMSD